MGCLGCSLRPKEKAAEQTQTEEDDQSGWTGPGWDAEPKAIPLPGTGDRFPVVGYGTWTNYQSKPEEIYRCVKAAIDAGYRHIDCAWVYDNEDEVGQAVNEKIEDGTVTRMDIFITTKIWTTYHARNRVKINLEKSLIKLQTPYVDLLLFHWPISLKDGDDNFPHTSDGKLTFSKHDLEETWQGMEDCINLGLTRNIGLSNFNSQQIQRILDCATLKPCNLQIEVNPTFSNEKLVNFALSRNIVVTAYAPLGSPERPWKQKEDTNALEDPVIKKIAIAKGKSPAQVMLRWIVQKNMCYCVKSLRLDHIHDDIDIFNFELTAQEMKKICGLNKNFRTYKLALTATHPEYPFHTEF